MQEPAGVAGHGLPLPRFVQIEPVGQCNLRCRMCPIQFRGEGGPGSPSAFMPLARFKQLLAQFGPVEELHLQGLGEPMLHPQFFEMVAHAAAQGMRVTTNTNMTVMTETHARRLVESGLTRLHVSLDGATAQTYEWVRLRARFERVLRNLRRVIAARSAAGSVLPEVCLVAVVMKRNLDELPALVQLASDEGVSSLSVQHLCHDFKEESLPPRYLPMRGFINEQTLLNEDRERVATVFAAARERASELGVKLRLPPLESQRHAPDTPGRSRCDWPWRGAYVSYDGRAMPCCMVATPDRIQFGNMAEEGVQAVWNNAAYQAFRQALEQGPPPEVCRNCALYCGTF